MQEPSHRDLGTRRPGVRSRRSGIFFHNRSLRPVWGILLFLLLVRFIFPRAIFALLLAAGLHSPFHTAPHDLTPREAIAPAVLLFGVLAATYLLSLMEQRMLESYGYRSWRRGHLMWIGSVTGVASMTLVIGTIWAFHGYSISAGGLHGASALRYAVIDAAWMLVVAYLEESLFRGYLMFTLTRGLSTLYRVVFGPQEPALWAFWTAAVVMSAAFAKGTSGNHGQTAVGVGFTFGFGLLLTYSLWRTGSLWWAIGFHTAWNWTQIYLFGVPASGVMHRDHLLLTHATADALRSGGSAGPEGSAVALVALLLLWIAVRMLPSHRVYPELWQTAQGTAVEPTTLR